MAASKVTILTRRDMESAEIDSVAGGTAAVFTTRTPGKETENEDAAALLPVDETRAILAVADGLGGQPAGAEAAKLTLEAIAGCVAEVTAADTLLRSAVLDGFERANKKVGDMGVGAGATVAAVEIDQATVRPYHVGDSTILVVGQRGKVKLHTVSHSPVGYAVEAGLLDEVQAIHHEDRHLVSNIVGSPEMRIEIGRTLRLRPRDTLVLGSDGLFDNLHLEEIIEYVRKGPLAAACDALVSACRRRMREPEPGHPSKPDDLTFLLYRCHP
ncbi:MAG: PP2C family protein-serine/threonine phosphatase [Planctomycetota bacterium]|jgi:serine/threonine protein phosphatase PrpC